MREYNERLKGIKTCGVLVCSVLKIFMYPINNLKFKELGVLLRYNLDSERLKGSLQKVELVNFVIVFLERIGMVLCRGGGWGFLL